MLRKRLRRRARRSEKTRNAKRSLPRSPLRWQLRVASQRAIGRETAVHRNLPGDGTTLRRRVVKSKGRERSGREEAAHAIRDLVKPGAREVGAR